MNLYTKYSAKTLVFDTTLASDILLRFRRNLLERMKKQIMIKNEMKKR